MPPLEALVVRSTVHIIKILLARRIIIIITVDLKLHYVGHFLINMVVQLCHMMVCSDSELLNVLCKCHITKTTSFCYI